jgi:DMSO/TMAO reductase YedYZ molybdopterin-dependent catalytic subunit
MNSTISASRTALLEQPSRSCGGAALLRPTSARLQNQQLFEFLQKRLLGSFGTAALFTLSLLFGPFVHGQTRPATAPPASGILVTGAVAQDLKLSLGDLKKLPRKSVSTKGHDDQIHQFDGVPIGVLLAKAGVPMGSALRGKSMALALVAEGSDGYRAVFSLAELDEDFSAEAVLVVDSTDGQPLGPNQGPLRLVVPADKRQDRWVRMLKSITVVNLAGTTSPSN